MERQIEKAVSNHVSGYNCSQAVACAFSDKVDIDEKLLYRMMQGFGTGMGCMEGICGAVSGAICIASLLTEDGTGQRAKSYAISRKIVRAFLEKNKSVICKELKGVETGQVLRDCRGCVADAAAILINILSEYGYSPD